MTGDADKAPQVRILRGNPTDDEVAAVVAVVQEAYAAEAAGATAEEPRVPSAWERATRAPRRVPATGSVWGRFEG